MTQKIFRLLIILCLLAPVAARAQETNGLFPIPKVPDENMNLTERCNYLVYNYWKECPMKRAFSSLSQLNEAFGQWAGLMPYASADTVHMAIDNFIKDVNKAAPKNMEIVGEMARYWFYCDSAQYESEEIYLPFCRAVAESKKVPVARRALYKAQLKQLESSMLGAIVPDIPFVTPTGETTGLGDVRASRVILFINDPDCTDCALAKARLSADYNLNKLLDSGLVKLVSLYPGEATDEWKAEAARYPSNWVVGASPDLDTYFDLPDLPDIYYLDGRHKVLGKNIPVDNILFVVHQINQTSGATN